MNSITSIYIPRMSAKVTEEQVIMEFDKFRIGEVRRVDFTPIVKRPGFGADVDTVVKSAFVHFRHYYYNDLTLEIMRKINDGESHRIRPACSSTNEYWILLKSTNPIPDTMMNPAQIVENCRVLESKVDAQALTIEKLEDKIERIHSVVYQLLGGLYCHKTQSASLDEHIDILFNEKTTPRVPDTSEWGTYPTTRQGDECERKIAVLEEELEALRLNAESDDEEDEEDDDSLSDSGRAWARITPSQDDFDYAVSVSSQISRLTLELPDDFDETFEQNLGQLHMPTPSPNGSCASIIKPSCEYDFESDDDIIDISTHSSMPSLIPIVESDEDSDSQKRRRTSQEICGNE
jgi:hypothetical protein